MIEVPLVVRKLALIGADLREILRLAGMTLHAYLEDSHAQVLAERYLERVIGRMIDINFHVITDRGDPPPRDYYESFTKLGTIGVLPPDLAKRLAAATGLRNRIAHEYDEIDHTKVHAGLESAARDVPEYLRRIQALLDATDPPAAR